ncbi:MAG TPA: hypothetical protein VFB87_02285 [Gaiellaceae bacterium]|jgi:hypothetical protein|nr:hypothetical protein [Gaiellaceae bacterium]
MEQISARAALVPASDLGDGLTTTIPRSDIQAVLAAEEEPIELVLDITRFSDGEAAATREISVAWERTDLEQLLSGAQGDDIVLTFDRDALGRATDDVEAHGLRETALVLAVAATAVAGGAASAAAEPGASYGGTTPIVQSMSPDDRAFARGEVATGDGVAADDRGFARVPPPAMSPDDRALPRTTPVATPEPGVSPDDRALPRVTPVAAPEPGVSPDDRALPRVEPPQMSPDDRALPRVEPPQMSPDDRALPRTDPVATTGGTVSDPSTITAPGPETVGVIAAIALMITGAYFLVGTSRRRVRPI